MIRQSRAILLALILPALVLPDGGLFCLCRASLTRAFTSCCRTLEARIPECCRKVSKTRDASPLATAACKGCLKLSTGISQSTHAETRGFDLAKVMALPVHAQTESSTQASAWRLLTPPLLDSGGRPPGPERTPPLQI